MYGKTRSVPLPPALQAELVQWADAQPGNLVFPEQQRQYGSPQHRSPWRVGGDLQHGGDQTSPTRVPHDACGAVPVRPDRYSGRPGAFHRGHDDGVYCKPITARQVAACEELEARLMGKVVTLKPAEKAG